MSNAVVFSVFIKLWNHPHCLVSGYFYHPQRNLYPVAVTSHSPVLGNHKSTSVFMNLPVLDLSHKWHQNIWAFVIDFFPLQKCFQVSSTLYHVSVLPLFLLPIIFYCIEMPHFAYQIHQLMDSWVLPPAVQLL